MIFASHVFLYYFLPLFLALYYLSPNKLRTLVLALASYVFYGWWRPDFVILMWASTVVDYTCGKRIEAARSSGTRGKPWLWVSLVVNLGLLGYFKYANFGVDSLNELLLNLGYSGIGELDIILPVGISFYTFQTLSYTVDVYRGQAPPVRSFRDFACYVAMFPQLVAGPIVRYNTVAEQLHSRTHTRTKFSAGVLAFQAGLAKKLLIADMLAPVADEAFSGIHLATLDAWLGVLAYTFQIYFDFSGYSDMAIGLGLMMGFAMPINFEQPYRSVDITDFWRRWHVSLSTFLRDYLYIPLGGNRKGPIRTYVNLALTMLLGGLWHGAAWTFVVWGAYQGFWLILERRLGKRGLWGSAPYAARVAITFVVAMFGWVVFKAATMKDAARVVVAMFGVQPEGADLHQLYLMPIHLVAALAAALVVWGFPTTQRLLEKPPLWWTLVLQLLFVAALAQLHYKSDVPFLYFQF